MGDREKSTTTTAAATASKSKASPKTKTALLILNAALLIIGGGGGPMVMRLYFLHGGKRVWLSSALETGGWPFMLVVLFGAYLHRRRTSPGTSLIFIKPRLLCAAIVAGVLTGADDYLYAYGVARLPISTSALIIASQLAFTALFAFILVRQKFTAFSINAVVLLTVGAAVLAMHTSSDRPEGESSRAYIIGFLTTVGASALYGFVLPLIEMSYNKARQSITYTLVLEFNMVMCFFATLVCVIGMIFNHDFQVIPREARDFGLGEVRYYVVLVFSGIFWQCFFLGAIGVIFCSSSLLSGIIIAVLLPVTEILAVIFYKEKFSAEKGVSLALSLWGFVSYFYGEIKQSKKHKQQTSQVLELPQTINGNDHV